MPKPEWALLQLAAPFLDIPVPLRLPLEHVVAEQQFARARMLVLVPVALHPELLPVLHLELVSVALRLAVHLDLLLVLVALHPELLPVLLPELVLAVLVQVLRQGLVVFVQKVPLCLAASLRQAGLRPHQRSGRL